MRVYNTACVSVPANFSAAFPLHFDPCCNEINLGTPQPDQDFHDQGFTLKRDEKTIGATRYEVLSVFDKSDLWEVLYVRAGSKAPILGVFSAGKCQDEAERILQAYERNQRR